MHVRFVGRTFARAAAALLIFTVVTGFLYPILVTGIGQLLFPRQANGSILTLQGVDYGCERMAQPFTDPGYLWGRPMSLDVTSFHDENGDPVLYAWPTNLSPSSREEAALVCQRAAALRAADPDMDGVPIPVDLVTVSGSGLDPEISPAAAEYQVHRIAQARGVTEDTVQSTIAQYTTGRFLGLFGEPRVNVLKVNLALDGLISQSESPQ